MFKKHSCFREALQDCYSPFHIIACIPEVESSRTLLTSRTHFEVLGLEGQVLSLGLEASSPRKLACPRLEDSTIFWIVKISWSVWKIFWKTCFCGDRLKNFCADLFFFFLFWRALALVSLVLGLGLEYSCPWPRECLSSERLSLALASDFFCGLGLGLEPCVLDSTSDVYVALAERFFTKSSFYCLVVCHSTNSLPEPIFWFSTKIWWRHGSANIFNSISQRIRRH